MNTLRMYDEWNEKGWLNSRNVNDQMLYTEINSLKDFLFVKKHIRSHISFQTYSFCTTLSPERTRKPHHADFREDFDW